MTIKTTAVLFTILSLAFFSAGCSKENSSAEDGDRSSVEHVINDLSGIENSEPEAFLETVRNILGDQTIGLDAVKFNDAGYQLYKSKEYASAATLFAAALELKPDYEYANYNLACTMALQKQQGADIDADDILTLLEYSLKLDPSKAEHMKQDTDLAILRNNPDFQALLEHAVDGLEADPASLMEGWQSVELVENNTILANEKKAASLNDIITAMEKSWETITGGESVMLIDEELVPSGFNRISNILLSPDGEMIFFVVNRYIAATDLNVYGIIDKTPFKIRFFQDGVKHGAVGSIAWSPNGEFVACASSDASGASTLYVAPARGAKNRLYISGTQLLAAYNKVPYNREDYSEGQGYIRNIQWINNSTLSVEVMPSAEGDNEKITLKININASTSENIVF